MDYKIQTKIRYFSNNRRLEFIKTEEFFFSDYDMTIKKEEQGYFLFNQDPLVGNQFDIYPVSGSYTLTIEIKNKTILRFTDELVFDGMTIVHPAPDKAMIPAIPIGHVKGYY